jgi:3'(2'), 5'-bisphosphate nucleotidase
MKSAFAEADAALHSAAARAQLLEAVVAVVRAANAEIMRVYAGVVDVALKADRSPLTEADLASHRSIAAGLCAVSPLLPLISEEGGLPDTGERAAWPAYWLIDPLDGTKEFLARNGEFTVNVALVESGRPTLGVVGVPARDTVFVGDVRTGVARRIAAGGVHDLRARRYAGTRPAIVASRRHGGEQLERALAILEREQGPVELRNVGSALKLCLLAEGEADVYPRLAPTSEWDTAAAQAVLEASGGAVLQLNGEPLQYNKADILNPSFVAVADPTVDWLRWFCQ